MDKMFIYFEVLNKIHNFGTITKIIRKLSKSLRMSRSLKFNIKMDYI